jgi:hypothetical protein
MNVDKRMDEGVVIFSNDTTLGNKHEVIDRLVEIKNNQKTIFN